MTEVYNAITTLRSGMPDVFYNSPGFNASTDNNRPEVKQLFADLPFIGAGQASDISATAAPLFCSYSGNPEFCNANLKAIEVRSTKDTSQEKVVGPGG